MLKLKLVSLLLVFSMASFAGLVTVNYETGSLYNTTALTGYMTHGDDMVGMEVTATFTDGSTEVLAWAATGYNAGGVSGTGWGLNVSGDTYSADWVLNSTTAEIDHVLVRAGPGDTMFDILAGTSSSDYGTDGSALGYAFGNVRLSGADLDIVATYSDLCGVGGAAPVGDLYLTLAIDFQGTFVDNTLRYRADTDNALYGGDINPVPEPSSLTLLCLGFLSLIGFAYRRKRK